MIGRPPRARRYDARMKTIAALILGVAVAVASPAWSHDAASAPAGAPAVVDKVERAVVRGARAAASGVERGARAAASGVERGARAAARGVKSAASGVQRGAKAAASGVERGVKAAAGGVQRAASAVSDKASELAKP